MLDDKDIQRLVYTVQLAEGDKLDVSPSSSLLLFTPKTVQITGDNDCTDSSAQPLFIAEMGHTLKGSRCTVIPYKFLRFIIDVINKSMACRCFSKKIN